MKTCLPFEVAAINRCIIEEDYLIQVKLLGQAGNDTLSGGAGNDRLDGGTGAGESLAGDAGNDTIVLGANVGQADGGDGNDVFLAAGVIGSLAAAATLIGGAGADTIVQTGALDLTNTFTSGVETLALSGALGAVTLRASLFDTLATITAASGATTGALVLATPTDAGFKPQVELTGLATLTVTGNAGRDSLTFGTASAGVVTKVVVNAGSGNDEIRGGGGDDTISGGGDNDLLLGRAGSDSLEGGGGADTLDGGAGSDLLRGGNGADRFRFASPLDGTDTILDFGGADRIEVSRSQFGGGLEAIAIGASLTASRFVTGTTDLATSAPGVGQFVYNTTTNTLSWDADGAGGTASIAIAINSLGTSLSASDILIIA